MIITVMVMMVITITILFMVTTKKTGCIRVCIVKLSKIKRRIGMNCSALVFMLQLSEM